MLAVTLSKYQGDEDGKNSDEVGDSKERMSARASEGRYETKGEKREGVRSTAGSRVFTQSDSTLTKRGEGTRPQ